LTIAFSFDILSVSSGKGKIMITFNAQIKALPVDRFFLSEPPVRVFFCAEKEL
jgi:hypothetical protein